MNDLTSGNHRLPDVSFLPNDYERIFDLICAAPLSTPGLTLLGQELERAGVIAPERAPVDLVQLRSIVTFTDLERAAQHTVQLRRPGRPTEGRSISVATPVGAALIGLRAGDTFRWRSPRGRLRSLRVDRVAEDPQAAERRETRRTAVRRGRIAELLSLD